ncbi:MAG: hypothetical protein U9N84_00590 [Actinomycetota bacterium]|nr:hypothetical protein [Actinomycetota bacterium]
MIRLLTMLVALLLVVAACGGDDAAPSETTAEAAANTDDAAAVEVAVTTQAPAADDSAEENDPEEDAAAEDNSGGGAAATVTMDNGEVFTFSILCSLEPQEAAGSEILFTVVSYDDPVNLDVTQFGADSFGGAASISLYDSSSYDTVWEANTIYGNEVELTLDGSTVRGSGVFLSEGDFDAGIEGVPGVLVAEC